MERLRVLGAALEVERIAGEPPVLVFLHEGLGSVTRWRDFPAVVAARTGRAGLVVSRRGYGQSDPAELPRPVSFMHEEALGVLPELLRAEGCEEVILIGHSDGASIALVYTGVIGAHVRGVVAMAPHVFVEEVCVRQIAALRAEYLNPETEVRAKLAKHHRDPDHTFLGWADVWLSPEFRAWNITDTLSGVRAPVLVLQGDRDEYGTLAQADAVCAGVSGPCERAVLPDCGHVPQRDQPDMTIDTVVRFVDRVARKGL